MLEFSQFLIMIAAFAMAVRLLFRPFVRRRPLVLAVTIIAALSSLFIAGEEMSWGHHFFHWNTPEYWAAVNVDDETNLHKTYDIFDKIPRVRLELGVLIGGILIPAAAWFRPQIRASRFALFFPAAGLCRPRCWRSASSCWMRRGRESWCRPMSDRVRVSSSISISSSSLI